jgi:heptosyltransferase II
MTLMIAYLAFVFVKLWLGVLRLLPLSLTQTLGQGLGLIIWLLDYPHRKIVLKNLRIAFPQKTSEELSSLARKSFIRIFQNGFSAAWVSTRSDSALEKIYKLSGVHEHLIPAIHKKKGVIHVMFHLGNWELLARIVSQIPEVRFSTLYQPLKNPYLEKMIRGWRSRSGVGLLNKHQGFNEAIRCLRGGEAVGILVDQHAGDHGMWVPFLDRLASTTVLPALLARRTGATIIPIFCHDRDGRWNVAFGPPIDSAGKSDGEIMFQIGKKLEEAISKDPASWFWLHDRWKTPSPNFLIQHYRRGVYVPSQVQLQPFKLLLRSPNWLGDAVLALPAVQAIQKGRPDLNITMLAPAKLADLWKTQGIEVATSVDQLEPGTFDAAILFPNSFRSAWEARQLGIPRIQGYAGHSRKWMLTAICPENLRGGLYEHEVHDFCALAKWSGAEVENSTPNIFTDRRGTACRALTREASYIVLHPGAAFGSAKRWLPERFVDLVKRFPQEKWKMIGSAEERERNASLILQMGAQVDDSTGKLSLNQLIELLKGAKTIVCNDSGPMHLAAAAGIPVVAIFGSTEPTHTGPLGEGHQVIRQVVECSPCYLRECPIDLRCMKAVSVDDVQKVLQGVLQKV